jgi:hypothetical protein
VGVISLYCEGDDEIGLEHRFFLQALGPILARVLLERPIETQGSAIRAHNDATREAVFAVLEPLLGSVSRADRSPPDHSVRLVVFPSQVERLTRSAADSNSLLLVEHAVIAVVSTKGFVVRLSETSLLLVTERLNDSDSSASLDDALLAAKRLGAVSREVTSALELRRILKEPVGHRDSQTDRSATRIH